MTTTYPENHRQAERVNRGEAIAHGRMNRRLGCGCPESASVFKSEDYGEAYIKGWNAEDQAIRAKGERKS